MKIWVLIFGMFLVTFIPRMFPMLFKRLKFPHWFNHWLTFVPYAILGALIFPGIMTVDPQHVFFGLVAGLVAFLIAWFYQNLIVIVLGSFLTMMILQWMYS
ncbi:AzlD domain-containing protein [Tepidibacillus fermentans]|uniref:Branched-subunit amino acid transport protein n=1 Tax=Tepidibacillus fermentans TaxID=1281767 RepID=A0A4V2USS6_9BACI|nr:AzlD domain-containing protein [Tepidibacillus fermentans]TCS82582.1 branched-subunit amino acid transport protein [Tepidibacillus fermentans]